MHYYKWTPNARLLGVWQYFKYNERWGPKNSHAIGLILYLHSYHFFRFYFAMTIASGIDRNNDAVFTAWEQVMPDFVTNQSHSLHCSSESTTTTGPPFDNVPPFDNRLQQSHSLANLPQFFFHGVANTMRLWLWFFCDLRWASWSTGFCIHCQNGFDGAIWLWKDLVLICSLQKNWRMLISSLISVSEPPSWIAL